MEKRKGIVTKDVTEKIKKETSKRLDEIDKQKKKDIKIGYQPKKKK